MVGQTFYNCYKIVGSALSDDRITAVEITNATLNDFETDIKGAIDSGANGTVTVSLELTDSVSKIIEFLIIIMGIFLLLVISTLTRAPHLQLT